MTNDSTKTTTVDGLILWAEVIAASAVAWAALYVLFNGKENAPKVKVTGTHKIGHASLQTPGPIFS